MDLIISDKEIKNFRKKNKISQEKFAEMTGVTLRTIQNYENGGKIPESKYAIFRKLFNEKTEGKSENTSQNLQEISFFREVIKEKDIKIDELNQEIGALKHEIKSLQSKLKKSTIIDNIENISITS